jgi:hypothetical protein
MVSSHPFAISFLKCGESGLEFPSIIEGKLNEMREENYLNYTEG